MKGNPFCIYEDSLTPADTPAITPAASAQKSSCRSTSVLYTAASLTKISKQYDFLCLLGKHRIHAAGYLTLYTDEATKVMQLSPSCLALKYIYVSAATLKPPAQHNVGVHHSAKTTCDVTDSGLGCPAVAQHQREMILSTAVLLYPLFLQSCGNN